MRRCDQGSLLPQPILPQDLLEQNQSRSRPVEQGRLSEAEQVLDFLKEQEFFEFVRRDSLEAASSKGGADLTPEESALAKSYNEIGGRLVALGSERGELVGKKILSPEETARLTKIEAELTMGS